MIDTSTLQIIPAVLSLFSNTDEFKTAQAKTVMQRQIDQLMYELFSLINEGFHIVEEATR